MKLDEFNLYFSECLEVPLREFGFARYSKSKSLIRTEGDGQLSLIRLGGRMSRAGCITHVACYRHTFLRTLHEELTDISLEPFDYPFKFLPSSFSGFFRRRLNYQPHIADYPYERIEFAEKSSALMAKELTDLQSVIAERIVPWAERLTPEVMYREIRTHGESAWCELNWLEDYENHFHRSPD